MSRECARLALTLGRIRVASALRGSATGVGRRMQPLDQDLTARPVNATKSLDLHDQLD